MCSLYLPVLMEIFLKCCLLYHNENYENVIYGNIIPVDYVCYTLL